MVEAAKRNAEQLGFTIEGRVADAEALPYRRRHASTWSSGTRCCTTSRTSSWRCREVLPGAQAGRPVRLRRRADRRSATGSPAGCPSSRGRRLTGSRSCRRCARSGPRTADELAESSRAAALEAVVDLHTFDPDALARLCAAGRRGRRPHGHRGADRGVVRLAGAHLRGGGPARRARLAVGEVRLPGRGSGCPPGSTGSWPGSCRRSSSTTCR